MSWITVIGSMAAAACFTLAAIHFLSWCQRRTARASLVFSLLAVAVAAIAACEFLMMRAEISAQFATALRWFPVPAGVLIVSLVGFVRLSNEHGLGGHRRPRQMNTPGAVSGLAKS